MNKKRMTLIMGLPMLAVALPLTAADAEGELSGVVSHRTVKRAQTVVYIEKMPGKTFAPPAENPVLDQKGKVFAPAVLPVLVGTQVDFLNSDDFEHNVFSPDGEKYDLGNWGTGETRSHTFTKPGVYTQLCRVHPEMVGYILVLETPYFALADEEGKFRLSGVPEGTWQLKVWNERLRPKQLKQSFTVEIGSGKENHIEISF